MKLKNEEKKKLLEVLESAREENFFQSAETDDLIGRLKQSLRMSKGKQKTEANPDNIETDPDWEGECDICGASPIVPVTGMCGPCTFGEADTVGGEW